MCLSTGAEPSPQVVDTAHMEVVEAVQCARWGRPLHLLRPRLSDEVRGTVSPMTERGRASQLKHLQQTSAKPFRRCWKMQSLPQSPTLMKKSGSRWKKHPSSRQRYCSSAYSCAPGLVRNRRSYVTLPEDTVFSSASCMHCCAWRRLGHIMRLATRMWPSTRRGGVDSCPYGVMYPKSCSDDVEPLLWPSAETNYPSAELAENMVKKQCEEDVREGKVLGPCCSRQIQAASRLKGGVTRARWCAQSLSDLAVFLQPLHNSAAAGLSADCPGMLHRVTATLATESLRKKEVPPVQLFVQDNGGAASDARATDCVASVGGWYSGKRGPNVSSPAPLVCDTCRSIASLRCG